MFQETDVTSYPSLLALFHRCKSSFDTYPDIILANAGTLFFGILEHPLTTPS